MFFSLSLVGYGGDPNSLCTTPEAFLYPPSPATETLNRVSDEPRPKPPPIAAEAGNVWPGAPAQVPTMVDLQGQETLNETARKPARSAARRARGGAMQGGAGAPVWRCRAQAGRCCPGTVLRCTRAWLTSPVGIAAKHRDIMGLCGSVAPGVGLEPTTERLTVACSTN